MIEYLGKFCKIQIKKDCMYLFDPRPVGGKYFGICYQEDEQHVYFKTIRTKSDGELCYGFVNRFPRDLVTVTILTGDDLDSTQ